MIDYQAIFKRYEIKYILTAEQVQELKKLMQNYMEADKYGNSTICNIYFDTPDFLLVRRSIEKPVYKEKFRIRSYGISSPDGTVFCELKKKCHSVVYKRRIEMTENQAQNYFVKREGEPNSQIGREIEFCFNRYKGLAPRVFLSYERQAFYSNTDGDFRMTFDKNIIWRDYDLSLCKGVYGNKILQDNQVLLEVKTVSSLPLWLVKFLSANKIYKCSFSKYGEAYNQMIKGKTLQGGVNCA
jgi:SPX domain protein involved in polyphosphate accumulation